MGVGVRVLIAALLWLLSAPAHAGSVLERVRADRVLHCGAVARPGIADAEGSARGVLVDLCRAVAVAVIGPSAQVSFAFYDAPHSYGALRQGTDEIGFLTGDEIAEHDLANSVVPGPTVLISTVRVMVPDASSVQHLAELTGQTVCLMVGSRAQRAFESAAESRHLAISRLTFEEDVEMLDAYNSGNCGAAAGEATYLAEMRRNPGIQRLASRFLPDVLSLDPTIAVTPRSDGDWSATVGWVIDALLAADAPAGRWSGSATVADPRPDWQSDVRAAVGSYGAIIRRNLTARLGLPPGPNAVWPAGMLLPPSVR